MGCCALLLKPHIIKTVLLTLLSDNRSKAACFRAERRGDFRIEALTTATFSGPVAIRGRPGDVCFNAEPVCLTFDTQRQIVFLSEQKYKE